MRSIGILIDFFAVLVSFRMLLTHRKVYGKVIVDPARRGSRFLIGSSLASQKVRLTAFAQDDTLTENKIEIVCFFREHQGAPLPRSRCEHWRLDRPCVILSGANDSVNRLCSRTRP